MFGRFSVSERPAKEKFRKQMCSSGNPHIRIRRENKKRRPGNSPERAS
jgi:hypothetical protein